MPYGPESDSNERELDPDSLDRETFNRELSARLEALRQKVIFFPEGAENEIHTILKVMDIVPYFEMPAFRLAMVNVLNGLDVKNLETSEGTAELSENAKMVASHVRTAMVVNTGPVYEMPGQIEQEPLYYDEDEVLGRSRSSRIQKWLGSIAKRFIRRSNNGHARP